MTLPYPDHDEDDEQQQPNEHQEHVEMPQPPLSFRTAMLIYAVLVVFCLATLHGAALFLALIIVFAIALKTWLARIRDRIQ